MTFPDAIDELVARSPAYPVLTRRLYGLQRRAWPSWMIVTLWLPRPEIMQAGGHMTELVVNDEVGVLFAITAEDAIAEDWYVYP